MGRRGLRKRAVVIVDEYLFIGRLLVHRKLDGEKNYRSPDDYVNRFYRYVRTEKNSKALQVARARARS